MSNTQKVALVTGGSRGLGKNMALSLAKKGINVIITYNSKKDEAEAVVAEIAAEGQKAVALQFSAGEIYTFDTFIESLKSALKGAFGVDRLDFLINNAGIGTYASFAETKEEDFDELFNIHLKGVFFLTQKVLPVLNDGGRIINLSSGLTRFSNPGYAAYSAMKGAIEVLSRYQAKELGERGIAVNTIAPGAIETDFGGGVVRDNQDVNKYIAGVTALGRVGLPDDIGPVIAFLCSEEGRWVNGQRIEISGGMYL
jgi:NAD(P)-dependent dehydrogenase (short-subunit alcohol dehydrogenase family)